MAAPIGHSIELYAVGELHLGFLAKPLELRPPLALAPVFPLPAGVLSGSSGCAEVLKLESVSAKILGSSAFFQSQRCRGAPQELSVSAKLDMAVGRVNCRRRDLVALAAVRHMFFLCCRVGC